MSLETILTELKAERDRLSKAIAALEGVNPAASASPAARHKGRGRSRRKMSAEARKRIGEAKRKWWAKQKKTTK